MIKKLKALKTHMDAAFQLGPELIRMDPDVGLDCVRKAWPDLANDSVKTGILKAFAFSKGLPQKHTHLIKVLDLGMADKSEKVREYAATYMAQSKGPQKGKDPKQKNAAVKDDLADIPSKKLQAGKDANKIYFLIGPREGDKPPGKGYKLLLVLPGGDGSEAFHSFVKRIYKDGIPKGYLVAQLVSVKWTPEQKVVWPHGKSSVAKMKFDTEAFIEDVVADVRKQHKIDSKYVFTLSWSSSGPAAYATSLQKKTAIKGSYVAMSVFKKDQLPALSGAKGHAYYIEHSPDDKVCPFWMAEQAKKELAAAKAKVKFSTYAGGHGWQGNVYGRIRNAVEWLEKNSR